MFTLDTDCDENKHTLTDSCDMFIIEVFPDEVVKLKIWGATPSKSDQWDLVATSYDEVSVLWDEALFKRPEIKDFFTVNKIQAFYDFVML